MLLNYFTYLIFFFIIFNALALITSKNPVQSVLLLVLVFIQTAVLFFLFGAEFLGILLITVYVGAIAILFLFVVMLLNLRIVEIYSTMQYHVPVGAFVGLLFAGVLVGVCYHDFRHFGLNNFYEREEFFPWAHFIFFESNLHALGEVFYNYYLDIFIIVTLLLLVAMIGVILLAVDFNYRSPLYTKDLVFDESLRASLKNVVWMNMEIYGKLRYSAYVEEWVEIFYELIKLDKIASK